MKKILVFVLLLAVSCSREVLQVTEADGGMRVVSASAGSFPILVTSDCVWSASSADKWIKINPEYRDGTGSFIVNYESNESVGGDRRFNRTGHIVVKTYDGAVLTTITVRQYGMAPFMEIPQAYIGSSAGQQSIPFHTNLTDRERSSVSCCCQSGLISNLRWSDDGEHITFMADEGSDPFTITVTFTDAWGESYSASGKINR